MEPTPAIDFHGADGRGLQVVFARLGDRYSHQILLLDGQQRRPLLESVEGSPQEPWPPSPPLQQIHLESRSDGRHVALLVGMAGRGHWSLSVEATSDPPALVFDVACRSNQSPPHLGSRYRTTDAMLAAPGPDEIVVGTATNPIAHLAPLPDGGTSSRRCTDPHHIEIVASLADHRLPATFRWRYRITLAAPKA